MCSDTTHLLCVCVCVFDVVNSPAALKEQSDFYNLDP